MKNLVLAVAVSALAIMAVASSASASTFSSTSSYTYGSSALRYSSSSLSYRSPSYYGQLNAAGFPKTQYVSPYITRTGRYVGGYYRNSPSDALRTCSIVRC